MVCMTWAGRSSPAEPLSQHFLSGSSSHPPVPSLMSTSESVLLWKREERTNSAQATPRLRLKPLKPQAPKPSVGHLSALSFSSVLSRLGIRTLMALLDYEE